MDVRVRSPPSAPFMFRVLHLESRSLAVTSSFHSTKDGPQQDRQSKPGHSISDLHRAKPTEHRKSHTFAATLHL